VCYDYRAFTGLSAYAAPAQATVVQQTPTGFVATAPRLQTYDAYPPTQQATTQHYALRAQVCVALIWS
jgi:hypothetical protein